MFEKPGVERRWSTFFQNSDISRWYSLYVDDFTFVSNPRKALDLESGQRKLPLFGNLWRAVIVPTEKLDDVGISLRSEIPREDCRGRVVYAWQSQAHSTRDKGYLQQISFWGCRSKAAPLHQPHHSSSAAMVANHCSVCVEVRLRHL